MSKFREGDKVRLIVPEGQQTKFGRSGIRTGDIGTLKCSPGTDRVEVMFPRFDKTMTWSGIESEIELVEKPTAPKNKETKNMTTKKPKPATVKPSAPKTEPSLYKAIRERLEAKDRETLHARTKKAVEAVENLLEGVQPVEERTIQNPAPAAPWSLDGLVVDPGEEAVGQRGFFWDEKLRCDPYFSKLKMVHPKGEVRGRYVTADGCEYANFAYIPNFPGAELLKRTTGYEAGK